MFISRFSKKEVTEYGFRRNLYGLRKVGILVSLAASAVAASRIYCANPPFYYAKIVADFQQHGKEWIALALDLLALAFWVVIVDAAWVRESANQYARALLATCDGIPSSSSSSAGEKRRARRAKVDGTP